MILVIAGFLSGILSGMGVGGGMLLIPALRIFADASQHTAQAVNLCYFIPSAASALFVHIKNKAINFRAAVPMIIGGVPLAFLGAKTALMMPRNLLGKLFAAFIFLFGITEITGAIKMKKE